MSKSDARTNESTYWENEVDELYRPFLIHQSTYMILTEQILTLMPQQRNVILTMNEYDIKEINPVHPDEPDSPTHVIIFCIRFITHDIFQPIGGLLTYKHHNQCEVLAECLKAYINDLWKLRLYVVATVSPSFKIFKEIISHLVNEETFDTYSDVISYAVEPIKEIVHIYDIQFLLIKLQNLFKASNIHFKEDSTKKKVFEACWTDMCTVFSLYREFKVLAEFLRDNEEISRRVHIFTEQIFNCFLETQSNGALSSKSEGCAVLLRSMRSFLKFTEKDYVELDKHEYVDSWNDLIDMLKTVTFQKSKFSTCTKEKPLHIHPVVNPSTKRKIDFSHDGTLRKDQEIVENKNRKSRNKNEKCVGDKKAPKRKGRISEREKLQSLVKIQELCELLKEKSFEGVIESQTFEQTKRGSNECLNTDDIHQKCHIDKNCDTDKNNNSDYLSDTKNIGPRGTSDIKIVKQNVEKYSSPINKKCHSSKPSPLKDDVIENSINKSCDKTPRVLELIEKDVENKGNPPDLPEMFEKNPVTDEMLCTILGMKKLLNLLQRRKVRLAKPNAFIIEHIDYFVKLIQEKNFLTSIQYYGHNYEFMNSTLAFDTMNNNKGLYLIRKD